MRQNYNRLAPHLAMQAGRYAHARQFKRTRKAVKKLKGYTGRVLRDLRRQLDAIPEGLTLHDTGLAEGGWMDSTGRL